MDIGEIVYKGFVLRPRITYEDGGYVAMLFMRQPDGSQSASGELGNFPCALNARRFALLHGMAQIDQRTRPIAEWQPHSKFDPLMLAACHD
jgi:hypothetical protein